MDETKLVLFELTRFLGGFWATEIGVSGMEVMGFWLLMNGGPGLIQKNIV